MANSRLTRPGDQRLKRSLGSEVTDAQCRAAIPASLEPDDETMFAHGGTWDRVEVRDLECHLRADNCHEQLHLWHPRPPGTTVPADQPELQAVRAGLYPLVLAHLIQTITSGG